LKLLITASLLLTTICGCAVTQKNAYQFALVGDNPYAAETYPKYERLIEQVNSQPHIQWVLHVGDVKGGDASCSDEELLRYFELNQRFNAPFIVTPGDNDWLDCKRLVAGGYDDYERLDAFRKLFYPVPGYSTGGKPMRVQQQSSAEAEFAEFVENAMWQKQDVVFATVHVVALTEPATDQARWDTQVAAASTWIRQAFAQARTTNAKGIFLAMQADPWVFFGLPALAGDRCSSCNKPRPTLEWLYPLLTEQTVEFGKPVVLAVGDTHVFRVDKPLYAEDGALVTNFTRVESFGSPSVHWVNVLVEPDTPWVFSFREQLVAKP